MYRLYTHEQNQQAQGALHQAWDEGLLDPLYFTPGILDWKPPQVDPCAAELLSREPPTRPRNDRITDQLDEPAFDTRAQLYQDVSFFHNFDQQSIIQPNTAYEVARFITAGNQTGFVKLCWNYMEIRTGGAGPIVEIDPRDPFGLQENFPPGWPINWYLRLEQGDFQRTLPAPEIVPIAQMGGYGFSPLNQWSDYRFQWGRTQSKVFWLVPQYHALRLYVATGASNEITRIGGRLMGWTQPIDVRVTGWNVAHGWS